MRWQSSQFLFRFLCLFLLYTVTEGINCKPGEMVKDNACVPCPENQFRSKPGNDRECLICSPCGRYSKVVSNCTNIKNTQCECLPGFKQLGLTQEKCRCPRGSGIIFSENRKIKECKKCEHGTFTKNYDSECQPWTKCDHSGVNSPGNATVDVVCKKMPETVPPPAITHLHQTTLYLNTSTISPTTIKPGRNGNSHSTASSATPVSRQHGLWLAVLGCILALLLIQFVIIKLKVSTCFDKDKKTMIRQDSACKKPVEESGDKNLLSDDV